MRMGKAAARFGLALGALCLGVGCSTPETPGASGGECLQDTDCTCSPSTGCFVCINGFCTADASALVSFEEAGLTDATQVVTDAPSSDVLVIQPMMKGDTAAPSSPDTSTATDTGTTPPETDATTPALEASMAPPHDSGTAQDTASPEPEASGPEPQLEAGSE